MDKTKIAMLLKDADWDEKKLWHLKEYIDDEKRNLKRLLKLVSKENSVAMLNCPVPRDQKIGKIKRDLAFLKEHRSIVRSRIHAVRISWKRANALLQTDPFIGSAFTVLAERVLTRQQYNKLMSMAIKLKKYGDTDTN